MSAEQNQTFIPENEIQENEIQENEIPVEQEQPVVPEQTIRPLNDVVLPKMTRQKANVIDLDRYEWRYSKESIYAFNKNQKEKGPLAGPFFIFLEYRDSLNSERCDRRKQIFWCNLLRFPGG